MKKNSDLLQNVADYYSGKLAEHGQSAKGVDWNGEESQSLRFAQLCKVINTAGHFSLNDLGCGYGALFDFLQKHHENFQYNGIDISPDMTQAGAERYKKNANAFFYTGSTPAAIADYSIASGIFNVRLDSEELQWREYIEKTLEIMNASSKTGFAFNCLTSYSDQEKMRDYLYYADPGYFFDLCKKRYSRNVALLHDYDLYEFTILVRKSL